MDFRSRPRGRKLAALAALARRSSRPWRCGGHRGPPAGAGHGAGAADRGDRRAGRRPARVAGRHVLHPAGPRPGARDPAGARLRGDQGRGPAGGRAAGPGRVRGADLVGAGLRPRPPGRSRWTPPTTRSRTSSSWSTGWPGSPGHAGRAGRPAGRHRRRLVRRRASRCSPRPTTTGSTRSSRRSPGTTWPPRCSRTRAGGGPAGGVFKKQWAGPALHPGHGGFGTAGGAQSGPRAGGPAAGPARIAGCDRSGSPQLAAVRPVPARASAPCTSRWPRRAGHPAGRSPCSSGPARPAWPAGSRRPPC